MNYKYLVFATFLFLNFSYADASCKLKSSGSIVIGCTTKCDIFTKTRLKSLGLLMGYSVKFKDLSSRPHSFEDLHKIDTLIIPGGADIHPKFYLKDVSSELRTYTENNLHLVKFTEEGKRRDLFEYTILKKIISRPEEFQKFPVLGICRGMQMMSVAQGLPLYLDLATELGIPNRQYKLDKIDITDTSSLMSSLYGYKKFRGVELHHQGIRVDYYQTHKEDYPQVLVSSYSNDGKIAESIEYKGFTALGVQYHPEKSTPNVARPIFRWLLEKACEYKNNFKAHE
jgi:gamma-glutamyl-gamma-aminobutyrate hydrolase PuuD